MTDDAYIADFARYIQASPSSYHAAAEAGRRLEAAGFTRLGEADEWPADAGKRYVIRDGAIVAWLQPATAHATTPFRILGAHTDSPGFKLKTGGASTQHGWRQVGVEVYGGPLLNSWLDRELEFAGRLVTRDGVEHLARTGPFLRIPQLAVHLDRTANDALTLDRQQHTQPVFGVGIDGDVLERLADAAGIRVTDIAGHDLLTADTAAPVRFGLGDALFASGRLDNLGSVFAGLTALIGAAAAPASAGASSATANASRATANAGGDPTSAAASAEETPAPDAPHISVLAAFDHEELGSQSRSGASGPLLDDILTRIAAGLGADVRDRRRALAASWCVSADAGHSVHPNYPERHDQGNRPVAGGGVLLKLNANQRYATDAHGSALWSALSAVAGTPVQEFVSNNTVPCGSTIGPLTATRLGIRTVDVGIPLLSMHSARELLHVDDAVALARTVAAFFAGE